MPIFEITAPNGKTYEVEGNGTQEQALAHFKANYKPEAPAKEVNPYESPMKEALANLSGTKKIMGGALAGLGGETIKNVGALTGLVSPEYGKPIAQFGEAMTNAAKEANPVTGTIGQIGSYVIPTNAIENALPKATSLLGNMAKQAGIGGAVGYGTTSGDSSERLKEGLLNAGVSSAMPILNKAISPTLSADVEKLIKSGVNLTPGQIMGGAVRNIEDKLTSVPLLGDAINYSRKKGIEEFNKAAFGEVLKPIGGKVPNVTGREGIDAVEKQLNNAYEKILPKITFQATPEFNANISNLRNMVTEKLDPSLAKRFDYEINNVIGKRLSPKTGMMDGISFKEAESELGTLAKEFKNSGATSDRDLGKAFAQAQAELRGALKSTDPKVQAELGNINKGWANFTRLQTAGAKANTAEMFTPSQLAQAVRQGDTSVRKGAVARGNALMQDLSDAGVNILPSKTPDSGTAGRLAAMGLIGGGAYGAQQGYITPEMLAIGGAAALPYLPGARKVMTSALTRRPDQAKIIAEQLRKVPSSAVLPSLQALSNQGE
jgi:hypothetical protein